MNKKQRLTSSVLLTLLFALSLFFAKPISAQDQGFSEFSEKGVTQDLLNEANPLIITGSEQAENLSTPGGILSRVLEFAFPIAGLILFIMILWGGFEIIVQSAGKKSVEAGRQRITAAIIGFMLLFSSYWIIVLIEQLFGIRILF